MNQIKRFVSYWLLPPGLTAMLGKMLSKIVPPVKKPIPSYTELDFGSFLRFGTGDNISRVPIKNLRYIGGRSFLNEQHHFTRFFKDGELALSRFYEIHQPKNVLEEHFVYDKVLMESPPPVGLLPWRSHKLEYLEDAGGLSASHGHQFHGPASRKKVLLEAKRLTNVLESINKYGYLPQNFDGYPRGYLLENDTNSPPTQRFLITSGMHRVAALSHLGFSDILVGLNGSVPRQIKISEINKWPGVQSGIFPKELAYKIFYSYFRNENEILLENW